MGGHETHDSDTGDARSAALRIVRTLAEAGHVAYFAGGCVRDQLLGEPPTDYDVATDARPEQVAALFRRVQRVGESFGIMLVRVRGRTIQVATFRTDGVYSDGRHPDGVTFTDAEHDATRRDFTINGLFEDPIAGKIIDHVGGISDIEARVVRAIGDPVARLLEDHLRMLRAVRFAARFGFSIDAETADAIRAGAGDLRGVSRERIGQEVKRMLSHANRAVAAWELQYLGLDEAVLLEPHSAVAPTRLGRLADDVSYTTALAAWVVDRHDEGPWGGVASRWSSALMLSNDERAALQGCLRVFETLTGGWARIGVAAQKRLAASSLFDDGLAILQATDKQTFLEVRRRVTQLSRSGLAPEPILDGNDLVEAGLEAGPIFKVVLDAVYDAQLEGSVTDRPGALRLASAIARGLEPADGG